MRDLDLHLARVGRLQAEGGAQVRMDARILRVQDVRRRRMAFVGSLRPAEARQSCEEQGPDQQRRDLR